MNAVDLPAQALSQPWTAERIAAALGYETSVLSALAGSVRRFGYRPFVMKKEGKRRVIAAPGEWLKKIQRALLDRVLSQVPIADCVYSKRGRDVVQNALQHRDRRYMVVVDVRDCFPSTTHRMVRCALSRSGFDDFGAGLITRLVTSNGRLPQGLPSSPAILNLVFADADVELTELGREYGAAYTRYMDDLCFSSDEPLDRLRRRAVKILHTHGYRMNEKKTRTWGPNERHTVTNIIVDSSLHPDPHYVRAVVDVLRSGSAASESILGQIKWIKRLDSHLGRRLERELARLQARRLRQLATLK